MAKVRVFSLAKELGLQTNALLAALARLGVENVSKASAIDEDTAVAVRELLTEKAAKPQPEETQASAAAVEAETATTTQAVAEETAEVISDDDVILVEEEEVIAEETVEEVVEEEEADDEDEKDRSGRLPGGPPRLHEGLMRLEEHLEAMQAEEEELEEDLVVKPLPEMAKRPTGPRPDNAIDVPPVVTVLGHIDHGKTTLLDSLRETEVAAGEAGGITQHIGASEITRDGKTIVFLDTPGHAAFTAMRARGAQVTDIAIIVVAANDGIMPQTVEAINHVKAAGVPIIVAVNKIDLPDANVERAKQQLLEYNIVPEEWGGDTIVVPISALQKEGLDTLIEMVLLLAEVNELWAEVDAELAGVIVEARLDSSQGAVSTVLVRNGTLAVGDCVVCGKAYGRVRRLRNWLGKSIKNVEPGHPAEVIGLSDVPDAGDIMIKAPNLKEARLMAAQNDEQLKEKERVGARGMALRELYNTLQGGETKDLNVIIKADAWGSAQALESSFIGLNEELEEVRINVIHSNVGEITESDVLLALASQAIIVGFHVHVDGKVRQAAENEKVEIRTYDIIYEALEDFRLAAFGMLEPIIETRELGVAEVLQVFKISRVGTVAGSRVLEGEMRPNADVRVIRDGEVIHRGKITSLKHFNQDVSVITAPSECGISVGDFRNIRPGDRIEASMDFEIERRMKRSS